MRFPWLSGTAGYFGGMGLPLPMVTAVVVSLVELLGGLFILAGFLTRPTAYLLAAFGPGALSVDARRA